MNITEFQRSTSTPSPVYLLITDQDYLRRLVYEHCLRQVEEQARAFDWAVFDLAVEPVEELLMVARTLPWMGPRRWIYAKNAYKAEAERLLPYLKAPSARTVLVLEMPKPPSSWPAFPVIEAPGQIDLVHWLKRKAETEGYRAEPGALETLVEIVGDDLQTLDSELEKQFLHSLDEKRITEESVRQMALEGRRYNVFALSDAIAEGRTKEALRILGALYEDGMTAPLIIATLYSNFRRLLVAVELLSRKRPFQEVLRQLNIWSYRGRERQVRKYREATIRQILIQLHASDRACKTTGLDEKTHLERVIVDTCRKISL
jgi:DNA polymerase-3 subunit delta